MQERPIKILVDAYEQDENGKEVLKANLYGDSRNNNSIALTHGLVYDMKTDMFVPIKDNKKWNK